MLSIIQYRMAARPLRSYGYARRQRFTRAGGWYNTYQIFRLQTWGKGRGSRRVCCRTAEADTCKLAALFIPVNALRLTMTYVRSRLGNQIGKIVTAGLALGQKGS